MSEESRWEGEARKGRQKKDALPVASALTLAAARALPSGPADTRADPRPQSSLPSITVCHLSERQDEGQLRVQGGPAWGSGAGAGKALSSSTT